MTLNWWKRRDRESDRYEEKVRERGSGVTDSRTAEHRERLTKNKR